MSTTCFRRVTHVIGRAFLFSLLLPCGARSQERNCPDLPDDRSTLDDMAAFGLLQQHVSAVDLAAIGYPQQGGTAVPLFLVAAHKGCLEFLDYYVQVRGTDDFDVTSPADMTALHLAVYAGHLDVVDFLLQHGADSRVTIPQIIIAPDGSGLADASVVTDVDARRLAELIGADEIAALIARRRPWWMFWRR